MRPLQKLMYIALLGAISSTVASCQSGSGTISDKHTGNTIVYSARQEIRGGLLSSLNARAVYSKRMGYGIQTDYMATGLGWVFFQEAWSFGRQYQYDVGDQKVLGCGGGCTILETGAIRLSEQDFKNASENGFEFKLIGKNGSVEGKLSAAAFKQVLDQSK